MIPKSMPSGNDPMGGNWFPACAKPWNGAVLSHNASAGEARSDQIMRKTKGMTRKSVKRFSEKVMPQLKEA
jgi:hypothetical protein